MKLSPLEIRKQEFKRGFRGFDADEVEAFLNMLSSQWQDILDENRRMDDRIRDLESKLSHYERVEEALQEALHTARDNSRTTIENAEQKGRLIIEQAEVEAIELKRKAEQERRQLRRESAQLKERRGEIATRLRAFLMSELELLARFEGDDPVGFIKLIPQSMPAKELEAPSGPSTADSDSSDAASEPSWVVKSVVGQRASKEEDRVDDAEVTRIRRILENLE
jgi:cell division initiation protein